MFVMSTADFKVDPLRKVGKKLELNSPDETDYKHDRKGNYPVVRSSFHSRL